MRPQQFEGQAGERRDERAPGLHPLCGQRPVRTMLARPAQVAKLAADHAALTRTSRSAVSASRATCTFNFFGVGALDLRRQRRAAARYGLAGVVRDIARSGQRHVLVSTKLKPGDLARALVTVAALATHQQQRTARRAADFAALSSLLSRIWNRKSSTLRGFRNAVSFERTDFARSTCD